jgi:hypothetical protein
MTTAFDTVNATVARRRQAEDRPRQAAQALALRLDRPWKLPRRGWDLENWRVALLEETAGLLEAAAGEGEHAASL